MDVTTLSALRYKLATLESGYYVGIFEPYDLTTEANELLSQYPDMPMAERERTEALKLASEPARGLVS